MQRWAHWCNRPLPCLSSWAGTFHLSVGFGPVNPAKNPRIGEKKCEVAKIVRKMAGRMESAGILKNRPLTLKNLLGFSVSPGSIRRFFLFRSSNRSLSYLFLTKGVFHMPVPYGCPPHFTALLTNSWMKRRLRTYWNDLE